jgi:hypothetical protein
MENGGIFDGDLEGISVRCIFYIEERQKQGDVLVEEWSLVSIA